MLLLGAFPSLVQAQYIGQNFTGTNLSQVNVIPPDTMGAVGVDYFVEFLNGRYATYRKSDGAQISAISDGTFWTNAGVSLGGAGRSDPRIIYDMASQRWFACQIDVVNGNTSNNVLLAVSNTSDPTAGWKGFKIDPNSIFADFPTMGLDATGVYVGTNNFGLTGLHSFQNVSLISVPKADLLLATPTVTNRTVFATENASNRGFALQPAIDFGPAKGKAVVLAVDANGTSQFNRTDVLNSGGPGAATLSSSVNIGVSSLSNPPLARQPGDTGSDTLLSSGDDRMSGAVFEQGNTLWAAHSISLSSRCVIRWYKIDQSTNAVLQSGTISDGTHDFFYPSLAANANGDVVMGFTRSGPTATNLSAPTDYASAYAAIGSTSGGTTTFGTPIELKRGQAHYDVTFGSGRNRWGDYSATNIDPADPQEFWTIQEWASATNVWSTQMTEIILPLSGEVRWMNAANGTFATGGNWFGGASPSAASHAIFSRATDPAGSGYTVSFGAGATTDRLSVRQGQLSFNFGGNTYSAGNTSASAPSVVIGEFGGAPTLTVTNGTLSSVNAFIAPGALSKGTVVAGTGGTWNSSGSVYVGGSDSAAGGTGRLTAGSGGQINVTGTLKAWAGGTVELNDGGIAAGSFVLQGGTLLQSAASSAGFASSTTVNGGTVSVTSSLGTLQLSGPLSISAGATLNKTGTGTLAISGTQTHGIGANLMVQAGTLNFDHDAGGNLSVQANATTNFSSTLQHLGSLSIADGITASVTGGANKALMLTSGLSFGPSVTGKLDLTSNDLAIQSTSLQKAVVLSNVTSWIKKGLNLPGVGWNGPGITSSTAAAEANSATALGVMINNNGSGAPLYPTFSGLSGLDINTILVKYTWFGDSNLDGLITRTDYMMLDVGAASGGSKSGWLWGDFDYSGSINSQDYALIDNAALHGGTATTLAAEMIALHSVEFGDTYTTSMSALADGTYFNTNVPEPGMIGLIGIGAMRMLLRRRRLRHP